MFTCSSLRDDDIASNDGEYVTVGKQHTVVELRALAYNAPCVFFREIFIYAYFVNNAE